MNEKRKKFPYAECGTGEFDYIFVRSTFVLFFDLYGFNCTKGTVELLIRLFVSTHFVVVFFTAFCIFIHIGGLC